MRLLELAHVHLSGRDLADRLNCGMGHPTPALWPAEKAAIVELGVDNLRRLARHAPPLEDGSRSGGCCGPLDGADPALEAPPTSYRHRAILDATAVVLLQWTYEE